jgi:Zn-finger nucleic acid-binding protein
MLILVACAKCQTQYDVSDQKIGNRIHCQCGGVITVDQPPVHEARLVRCSACGSSRGGSGTNCEFCGALFSTVDKGWGSMCPGCFCRLPNDAQFCVDCGLKISPQKLGATRPDLLCPRCQITLQQRAINGIEMEECGSCAGLWLPVATFHALIEDRAKLDTAMRGLNAAKRGDRRNKFEISEQEEVKYVPCPTCKALMNRRNFGRISGVIIDTCRDCGVWLDNQELNRIVQFVSSGGMEKSREFEATEREHAEKMREKRKKPAAGLHIDVREMYSSGSTGGLKPSEIVVPVLAKALKEVARAFFKYRI